MFGSRCPLPKEVGRYTGQRQQGSPQRLPRRLERLATLTPLDNRISHGCIDVPARFYEKVVRPAFTGTEGIVYVLPETRPARDVFGSYDVPGRSGRNYAAEPTHQSKARNCFHCAGQCFILFFQ